MARRRICVVSGTRAEYGLLYWLLRAIQDNPNLELQLVLTGAHLSHDLGYTKSVVEDDGFPIAAEVDLQLSTGSRETVAKAIGRGVIGFTDAFQQLDPDLLVVLGDRYEILAAAIAAMVAGIPIAHIHGGESTEGAIDEAIRHAVTKMSHLHFVASDTYGRRVVQLGEHPDRVWTVGALGLDSIRRLNFLSRSQLETALSFRLGQEFFLVTYHPETLGQAKSDAVTRALIAALDEFPQIQVLWTKANADPEGSMINEIVSAHSAAHSDRVKVIDSLGQLNYLSALKHAIAVVGNSSSGIIEAPAFGVPTVNIGNRQTGRSRAPSVIDCAPEQNSIASALKYAISLRSSPGAQAVTYGDGLAGERIAKVLGSVALEGILVKKFHDLEVRPG